MPADLLGHTLIHVLGYKEGWALWLKKAGVNRSLRPPVCNVTRR